MLLVFDLAMESLDSVRVELVLPDLASVPDDVSSITKTGRLSMNKMTQRDRTALYEDLCYGLALRLAYETFLVILR